MTLGVRFGAQIVFDGLGCRRVSSSQRSRRDATPQRDNET